jgi:hypothetical protein
MSWVIQDKSQFDRLKGTNVFKFKYKIYNEKTHQINFVLNWTDGPVIVYDEIYDSEISNYNWSYNNSNYAYTHNKTPSENDNKTITMHKYIMQLANKEKQNNDSIDHINQIKTHNVIENLRYVTQAVQNNNRQSRSDRVKPPQELINIGINDLPRYIRYDNSENKSVIERSHPGFERIDGKFISDRLDYLNIKKGVLLLS